MKSALPLFALMIGLLVLPARGASTTVLLLPFEPINPDQNRVWIGSAIQQTLLSELGQSKLLHPTTRATPAGAVIDVESARASGQKAGVTLVIFGSYQLVNEDLRFTGQVLDVATGKLLGGMKATGALRDLFGLQDSIADQARQITTQYALASAPKPSLPVVASAPTTAAPDSLPGNPRPTPIQPSAPSEVDFTLFDRHNHYLDYYERTTRRYYDEDDYLSSNYRYNYSPYYPYPRYYHHHRPGPIRSPVLNNPPFVAGPYNIGGTISIGGSVGSGHRPPTIGTSISR